jgi:hypothetical protein
MEYMNAIMEQYLQAHMNDLEDDWSEWLPLIELATNHQALETTGSPPFFGNEGFDHRYQFHLLPVVINVTNDQ